MKIISTVLAILLTSGIVQAQEGYDKIKVGDRIQITLRNKNSMSGHVALPLRLTPLEMDAITEPDKFDLSKETYITLDLSLQNPGLGKHARIAISRDNIRKIRVLAPLTPEEEERLKTAAKREQDRINREEAERQAYEDARTKKLEEVAAEADKAAKEAVAGAADETEAAEREKALEFYARFPEELGWGTEKFDKIMQKNMRRQLPTADEREFLKNYDLWRKGKTLMEEYKAGSGSKSGDEKEGEEGKEETKKEE
jgi:hypothetical protein